MSTSRPIGYRDAAGKPAGFLVEALNAAAEREGLTLEWRLLGGIQENDDALRRGDLDVVAGVATPERRRDFYVTEPWWSAYLMILFADASSIRRESDLNGRRVAVPQAAYGEIARLYPRSQIVTQASAVTTAQAVCRGEADAGVVASMYLSQLLSAASSPPCKDVLLRTLDSSARVDYVLTGRRDETRSIRALKSGLDEITADGTLAAIADRNPPVSAPHATRLAELLRISYDRQVWTIISAASAIVILLGAVFIVNQIGVRKRLRAINMRLQEDLLARERAEAALRDSEARFRALFDSAPQTVIAVDRSGTVVFANERSREMFGNAGIAGGNIADLVPERFRKSILNPAETGELAGLRADGNEFPIEIGWGMVETDEGLTLAFITDISERVALQQQLLQSQKLESVGHLAGGVAHDFNNLLTVISGYSQMILDDLPPQDTLQEPLGQISQAANRASALTRQLLTFSRRQSANPKLLALNDLLRNLEKMLRRLIGEDIEMTLRVRDTRLVRADPGQIEQAVVNLVVNSRDAMANGGKLTIETEDLHIDGSNTIGRAGLSAGDYVTVRVTDTGCGMTSEVQAHIFEPFFTTKEQGKGTGLGLSTVYGIVKQSGGEVLVESEPGKGTSFLILLPAAEGAIQPEPETSKPSVSPGYETVLVAEDESDVRTFVKNVLTAKGYRVLEAANGQEALKVAAGYAGPIHLLVSDLIMPLVGGIELADRIRQIRPDIAILHISGYSDRLSALDPAILLRKPFTPAALLLKVREILSVRRGV
jgi:PAS domain S-box-containing protein